MIDVGAFTLVQTTFLQHIDDAFSVISIYATHLLYFFAIFEIVIFGLLWAFSANSDWSGAFLKILKIGLILFIIQDFGYLTSMLISSFAQIGGDIANTKLASNFLFNPSLIWQYGYDVGLMLLKSASLSSAGIGFPLVQLFLGIGILLVFGLMGIQIVLQIVGFYLVTLTALVFIPFGVFNPASALFSKAVQAVLKAGVRVMALVIVIGLTITVLSSFELEKIQSLQQINQPLGIFFIGLLFLFFAFKLPTLLADVVGEFMVHERAQSTVVMQSASAPIMSPSSFAAAPSPMQQATMIQPGGSSPMASGSMISGTTGSPIGLTSAGLAESSSSKSTTSSPQAEKAIQKGMRDAARMQRSLSEESLKEIKKLIKKSIHEK
jgi:type IV secretion system protein TrbL